jgi:LacI family transcriptional regulator
MKSEDIAKIAGVSRSTVSRVINNYPNVPEETRLKVMEVITKYDYRPNAFARTLAGKKSETIGVFFIIDGVNDDAPHLVYNDFYTAYLDAIVDIANKKGYYVLVQTVYGDHDYSKITKAFNEKRIDGGILIGTRKDTLTKMNIENITQELVIFDFEVESLESFEETKHVTILNSNDEAAMDLAVKHLVDLGHCKIGFIKGIEETLSARQRYNGFIKACKHYGVKVDQRYILEGEFNQEVAYRQMAAAIDGNTVADAYICANDYMAIAAIDCLREHQYKIPEDVSFIGFDNTRTGQLMTPKLTTLTPDFYGMAKKAVELIHLKNEGESVNLPDLIEYKVDLITRESVVEKK